MADIIRISTANRSFSTTESSNILSVGDFNNDQQPEIAPKPEILISLKLTDTFEIPTANLGYTSYKHIELEKSADK